MKVTHKASLFLNVQILLTKYFQIQITLVVQLVLYNHKFDTSVYSNANVRWSGELQKTFKIDLPMIFLRGQLDYRLIF